MANVTSGGRSGDSNEINAANFRERLKSAQSDTQIKRVASAILNSGAIQKSIVTRNLTSEQRAKLIPLLGEAAEEAQAEGKPTALDVFQRVFVLVAFGKDISQVSAAKAVKELTKLADMIHGHCTTLNQQGLDVVEWLKSSAPDLKTTDIEKRCSRLQELAKDWGTGGTERELFMDLVKNIG